MYIMKSRFYILRLFALALPAMMSVCSYATDANLPDEYQQIVDKNLFGPPPADPSVIPDKGFSSSRAEEKSEREIAKEQEKLEKTVYVSALTVSPDGAVKVGFTDTSNGKKPSNHYLAVGASEDGWLVVSADMATKKVVLSKDGIEIERIYGDKNASSAPQDGKSGPNTTAANPAQQPLDGRSSLLSRRPGVSADGRFFGKRGAMSRRAMRRQVDENERLAAQQREESRTKAAEAERQREREETAKRFQMLQDEVRSLRESNAARQGENNGEMHVRE